MLDADTLMNSILSRPYTFRLRFTSSIFSVLLRASDLIRRIPLKRSTYVWHRFRFTTALRDLSYTYLTLSKIYGKSYNSCIWLLLYIL